MKTILTLSLLILCFTQKIQAFQQENDMTIKGSFDIELTPQEDPTSPAGRMLISKAYTGGLSGKAKGQMLSKRTSSGTAAYTAIEEFEGKVEGKQGAFTLIHVGFMSPQSQRLDITILEGSGTGELTGISGTLSIIQEENKHYYELTYSL